METTLHPFEAKGLGKAPFRLLGVEWQDVKESGPLSGQRVIGTVKGVEVCTKPGGTCAYCHTYIVNMFRIESADGQRFHVGSDCVCKVDAKLGAQVAKLTKENKRNRDLARIERAKANLAHPALLQRPHPTPGLAAQGKTIRDYCEWLLKNGGHTGKLRAAKLVELYISPHAADE